MKNVRYDQLKKCICIAQPEFDDIIKHITGDMVLVRCDHKGISYEANFKNPTVTIGTLEAYMTQNFSDITKFYDKLAKYLDVGQVTSIHIDDTDMTSIGIWVCYVGDRYQNDDVNTKTVTADTLAEFKGQIVDIFEDYLEENGFYIPNKERDDDNPDDPAHIWGDDYDLIGDVVEASVANILNHNYPFADKDEWFSAQVNDIYEQFVAIISKNPAIMVYDSDKQRLLDRVRDTYDAWNLLYKNYTVTHDVTGQFISNVRAVSLNDAENKAEKLFAETVFDNLCDATGKVSCVERSDTL